VRAVSEHIDALGDTQPVVVTFADDPERLGPFAKHLGVDFPLVADVNRELYTLLGAGRGTFRQVWSRKTIAMYVRLMRDGRRLHKPIDDTRQLGADALIDRQGRLHRLWLPASPDARPTIDEIMIANESVPEI
jgi:hypothetical protein